MYILLQASDLTGAYRLYKKEVLEELLAETHSRVSQSFHISNRLIVVLNRIMHSKWKS